MEQDGSTTEGASEELEKLSHGGHAAPVVRAECEDLFFGTYMCEMRTQKEQRIVRAKPFSLNDADGCREMKCQRVT